MLAKCIELNTLHFAEFHKRLADAFGMNAKHLTIEYKVGDDELKYEPCDGVEEIENFFSLTSNLDHITVFDGVVGKAGRGKCKSKMVLKSLGKRIKRNEKEQIINIDKRKQVKRSEEEG